MTPILPWFAEGNFPLYLAPMAGVSDKIFRQICKSYGADVLVTEFVSAEGVFRRNERTREYLDFDEIERPIGVQLFGANAAHMAEAARHVVDWVRPDFIDLNFGCPVNKVVAKNGGSALLKDCPTLAAVTEAVVSAVAPIPVTAKIRIGWDADSINAPRVGKLLEELGIAAIAVHGRTRAQGYSGVADWNVIGEVAAAVSVPVIGNGDLTTAAIVAERRARNRNCRRDAWSRRDERALDLSANQNLLCDGGNVTRTRAGRTLAINPTSLPSRRRGMGRGRTGYPFNALPAHGVLKRIPRWQTSARTISACLHVVRYRANCRRAFKERHFPKCRSRHRRSGERRSLTAASSHRTFSRGKRFANRSAD